MRLLGALIAGGASRRFGSDKALTTIGGVSLIDHARGVLEAQVDELVLCGRPSHTMRWIVDRPAPGLGPLGGLSAALADARARGYDAVVTVPIDVFPLPLDIVDRLGTSGASVFATQHLIGLWPAHLGPRLDLHLSSGHRSLRSWIEVSAGRTVDDTRLDLSNVNTRADLAAVLRLSGLSNSASANKSRSSRSLSESLDARHLLKR